MSFTTLGEYVAAARLRAFEALRQKLLPPEGDFDVRMWQEFVDRPAIQMGTTRYEPSKVIIEFVAHRPPDPAAILAVTLTPPEPIIYMPVPEWVIENVWKGEVNGTYCFQSEASLRFARFADKLKPETNKKYFGSKPAVGRE